MKEEQTQTLFRSLKMIIGASRVSMKILRLLARGLIGFAIIGASVLIWRSLSQYSLAELQQSLVQIPAARYGAAFGFAAVSYLCLTGFDWLGVRYAGKPLGWRRTALASFASLSIGHNIGVAALSSGAIRYRYYSRWGLNAGDVAKIILFAGMTVGLGLATLGGLGLLFYPAKAQLLLGLGSGELVTIAALCLTGPIVYLMLATFMRRQLRIRHWKFDLPELRLALSQVALGTLNFACVAACLHQLIAASSQTPYLEVATVYVIGNVTALISHVPGGLGVLEATVLYLLPDASALGAIIAFRVVYFFVPLALGLPLFLASEYFLHNRAEISEYGASQPQKG